MTDKEKKLLNLLAKWIELRRTILAGESAEMAAIYRQMEEVLAEPDQAKD